MADRFQRKLDTKENCMRKKLIIKVGRWWLKRQLEAKDQNITYLEEQVKIAEEKVKIAEENLKSAKEMYNQIENILDKYENVSE